MALELELLKCGEINPYCVEMEIKFLRRDLKVYDGFIFIFYILCSKYATAIASLSVTYRRGPQKRSIEPRIFIILGINDFLTSRKKITY